jgi:hypothetical protein
MSLRPFLLLLLAYPSAVTAAAPDEGLCRNGMFGEENSTFGLGKVAGVGPASFVYDMQGCPNVTAQCRLRSYVIPGQRVVIGRTHGRYICAYYPSKGGGTAGWLDTARIEPLAVRQNPPISAWVGRWSDEGNPVVRLYVRQGKLTAHGFAAWPSFDPPLKQYPGGPHTGEIEEPLRLADNRAYARGCEVIFTLLGDLIVAADPTRQCDGANVSFTGVYRRVSR